MFCVVFCIVNAFCIMRDIFGSRRRNLHGSFSNHRASGRLGGNGRSCGRRGDHKLRSLTRLRNNPAWSGLGFNTRGSHLWPGCRMNLRRIGGFQGFGRGRFRILHEGRDDLRGGNGAFGCIFLLLQHGLHHIAGLGDARQINLGLWLRGCGGSGAGRGAFCASASEKHAHPLRLVVFQRAGVGLFLGYADLRQRVKNLAALDFQFACQIVDSNFTHPPLSPSSTPDVA